MRVGRILVVPHGRSRGIEDDVAFDEKTRAPLVEVEAVDATVAPPGGNVADQVAADDRAGLKAEGVDAAAIPEALHSVVDVVILDNIGLAGCWICVPLPSDGDTGVGEVMDEVVRDEGSLRNANPDTDGAVEIDATRVNVIVGNAVPLGNVGQLHLRPRVANHDAVGADVEYMSAFDAVVGTSFDEFDPAAAEMRK